MTLGTRTDGRVKAGATRIYGPESIRWGERPSGRDRLELVLGYDPSNWTSSISGQESTSFHRSRDDSGANLTSKLNPDGDVQHADNSRRRGDRVEMTALLNDPTVEDVVAICRLERKKLEKVQPIASETGNNEGADASWERGGNGLGIGGRRWQRMILLRRPRLCPGMQSREWAGLR